jgi:riboflavin transporter FmnP
MITVSPEGPFGLLMNVVSTLAFVLPPCIVYRKHKTLVGAIVGLCIGIITVTAVMAGFNYLIVPIYRGFPRAAVVPMLLPVFVPFNLFKATANTVLTVILFKPLVTALRKAKLIEQSLHSPEVSKTAPSTILKWGFVVAGLIIAVVVFLLYGEFSIPQSTS